MTSKNGGWLLLAFFVFGLTCLAYLNSFHVPFHFDDFGYPIGLNSPFAGLPTLMKHFSEYTSRSLVLVTFSFQKSLLSMASLFWWHLPNFLIHLSVAVVLYFLLLNLLKMAEPPAEIRSLKIVVVLLVGLFLLHPINIQAVTYLSQRFTSLSALFILSSLYCYLKYAQARQSWWYLIWAFCLGFVANLCKENAAVVAILWLLVEFTIFANDPAKSKPWVWIALMFIVPILIFFIGGNRSRIDLVDDTTPIWWQYLATQSKVILLYLKIWLWPTGLNVDHQPDLIANFWAFEPLVFGGMILALISFAWMKRRRAPLMSLAILMFFVSLAPDSSVMPLPDYMYEHRMYLAGAALLLLMGLGCIKILSKWQDRENILYIALAMVCMALTFATYQRHRVWASEVSLWEDCLAKSPANIRAHMRLGKYYFERQEFEKSLYYFSELKDLRPQFYSAWTNVGVIHAIHKNYDEAITAFEQALKLKPDIEQHYDYLAKAFGENGQKEKAQTILGQCVAKFGEQGACAGRLNKMRLNQ